jgi:hypothetical protein
METNKKFEGDIVAKPGTVYEYEEITGSVYASGADTKTSFPKLTTVGGYVDASGADTKTSFPKHAKVGGYVDASGADTKTSFPKLTTVGGYVYASGADTKTSFPKLTTVGGYVDASGADTKTSFPKLTTVGGYVDARGAEHVKTNDPSALEMCRKNIFHANLKLGYYYVDGILARLVNRKGKVARVVICGKTAVSYVVEDARGNYSHGVTLAEARSGLMFKLSSRDTSIFKKWTRDTKVSSADAIMAYRAITGACEQGTRHFCEGLGKLPDSLTVGEVIERTNGQYGSKEFSQFFEKAKA